MPGRPRKPLALRLLQGGGRKETLNLDQPIPAKSSAVPEPVAGMSEQGSAVWRTLAPVLFWLTDADLPLFRRYCEGTAHFDHKLAEGKFDVNISRELKSIEMQIGMTPSARSKVQAPKDAPTTGLSKYTKPKLA